MILELIQKYSNELVIATRYSNLVLPTILQVQSPIMDALKHEMVNSVIFPKDASKFKKEKTIIINTPFQELKVIESDRTDAPFLVFLLKELQIYVTRS